MAGHLIAEVDISSGQIKREYLWLGDTPRLITDTAKRKRWDWNPLTNEPFGATQPNQTPTSGQTQFILNLRFAGQYHDSETGTFYNHFRTYQPQWGRYVQSDPIGLEGGLNTYGYVEANPLSKTDPMGLSSTTMGWGPRIGAAGAAAAADGPLPIGDLVAAGLIAQGIYEMCKENAEECRKKCDAAYNDQIRICKMSPTAKGRSQCYASAANIYGQCLKVCK